MIRILLIEDNPGDALAEGKVAAVALACADRLSSGLQLLAEGGMDLILLDLSLPDSRGFETFAKADAQAKGLPLIVLSGLNDEVLAMKAVRQGAQDYLVKGSLTAESLMRSIRFSLGRHKTVVTDAHVRRRDAPGRVLGFLGAKGGVGTTTVALDAAAVLAKQGKSVVALELRSFGSSFSLQTQLTATRSLSHVLDLDAERITEGELEICLTNLPSGVKAIFAAQRVADFRQIQPAQAEAIIHCASQMADYVIADLPSEPGHVNRTAIRNCDALALVIESDTASVEAGRMAVRLLEHWGVEESSVTGMLVVKHARAGFTSPMELEVRLGCPVASSVANLVERLAMRTPVAVSC